MLFRKEGPKFGAYFLLRRQSAILLRVVCNSHGLPEKSRENGHEIKGYRDRAIRLLSKVSLLGIRIQGCREEDLRFLPRHRILIARELPDSGSPCRLQSQGRL